METYVILGNYTQKGVSAIKEGPSRVAAVRKAVEAAGGKLLGFYLTMGGYDFVVISEIPSFKVGATVLLSMGAQGNVRTESMRALTEKSSKKWWPNCLKEDRQTKPGTRSDSMKCLRPIRVPAIRRSRQMI